MEHLCPVKDPQHPIRGESARGVVVVMHDAWVTAVQPSAQHPALSLKDGFGCSCSRPTTERQLQARSDSDADMNTDEQQVEAVGMSLSAKRPRRTGEEQYRVVVGLTVCVDASSDEHVQQFEDNAPGVLQRR